VPPGHETEAVRGENPRAHVLRQARAKALGAELGKASGIVLGGDTVVSLEGRILGKPGDAREAEAMLEELMGRTHEVWSGLALVRSEGGRLLEGSLRSGASCSRVRFGHIPGASLRDYLAGDEWRDKAGAYGIQGWAGGFADLVEGSLDNVIGLPMELFARLLEEVLGAPGE